MMNIEEIKSEFGDCDWLRAVLNGYTVDAILWMINRIDELETSASQPEVVKANICKCDPAQVGVTNTLQGALCNHCGRPRIG